MYFFVTLLLTCFFCVAAVIVGGIDMMSQSLVLAKKPHIVIGKTSVITFFHTFYPNACFMLFTMDQSVLRKFRSTTALMY